MSTLNGGPGNIVTNGLVLYLDAANYQSYVSGSTTWRDLSSSNLSGSLINGPTYSSGNAGSIVFDGTNDYMIGPLFDTLLNYSTAGTIEIWFNLISNPGANYRDVWSFIGSNRTMWFENDEITNPSPILRYVWRLSNGSLGALSSGISYSSRAINNVVCNYSTVGGNTNFQIYVNGILIDQTTSAGSLTNDSTSQLKIGYDTVGYQNMRVYSFKIYNRALTASEVLQNYNATKGRFGL
jgi:hypothetical protein